MITVIPGGSIHNGMLDGADGRSTQDPNLSAETEDRRRAVIAVIPGGSIHDGMLDGG